MTLKERASSLKKDIPAVLLAAAAELFEKQLHLDDNFTIPMCVGLVITAALFL